jgi:transposase-like protein
MMLCLKTWTKPTLNRRFELFMGRRQRRHWTAEEKARIVAESSAAGVNISDVPSGTE